VRDKTQIICATIAFGMGIDKSNVRWIIHYNLPKNIEGYYQEFGRAGRDSAPAQALLFYTYADVEMIKRFFIDTTQGDLQHAKLERIKEYAEGVICRRQILLRYFDESYEEDCGNCDVCANPFSTLNGTAITKKALETLSTLTQQQPTTTQQLVSALSKLSQKVSFASWHFYLAQMKNLGLIQVDFSKNQALSITKKGQAVLSKNNEVRLVLLDTFIERQEQASKTTKSYTKNKVSKNYYENELYDSLKEIRKELANKHSLAAYMIFSDKTLLEMANEKPTNKEEMLNISGVGEVKWERYGQEFTKTISESIAKQ